MSEHMTQVHRKLDNLPDDTLIEASGTYRHQEGTFQRCWARPIPTFITGTEERAWEVMVWGSQLPQSMVPSANITSYRVLYQGGSSDE